MARVQACAISFYKLRIKLTAACPHGREHDRSCQCPFVRLCRALVCKRDARRSSLQLLEQLVSLVRVLAADDRASARDLEVLDPQSCPLRLDVHLVHHIVVPEELLELLLQLVRTLKVSSLSSVLEGLAETLRLNCGILPLPPSERVGQPERRLVGRGRVVLDEDGVED
eukprot:scaffold89088_cov35-Tisochrysis_lutea.AAC.1